MVLGITGISGTGKHTAADFFAQKGSVIFDVDKIAHYLYRPYTHVWKTIVQAFGEGVVGQNDLINRQKLGRLVFDEKNPATVQKALNKLNQIVHPAIRHYLDEQIHQNYRRSKTLIIVAALWKELGLDKFCDKILLIKADSEIAYKRIQQRDSLSRAAYDLRVRNQSAPKEPDWVIINNGTVQEFYLALAKLKF